jgi:hypothetical protein
MDFINSSFTGDIDEFDSIFPLGPNTIVSEDGRLDILIYVYKI